PDVGVEDVQRARHERVPAPRHHPGDEQGVGAVDRRDGLNREDVADARPRGERPRPPDGGDDVDNAEQERRPEPRAHGRALTRRARVSATALARPAHATVHGRVPRLLFVAALVVGAALRVSALRAPYIHPDQEAVPLQALSTLASDTWRPPDLVYPSGFLYL